MSDTGSDVDSISDASTGHSDEALLPSAVREVCNQLRANDPRLLKHDSVLDPSHYLSRYSDAEWIAVFQALKENTSVKHIDFTSLFEQHITKRSALVTAEYLGSSKTLQTLNLGHSRYQYCHKVSEMVSVVLRALSRNTSVTKLIITTDVVRFASVAFQ
jgi:hypothetical protein